MVLQVHLVVLLVHQVVHLEVSAYPPDSVVMAVACGKDTLPAAKHNFEANPSIPKPGHKKCEQVNYGELISERLGAYDL